MTFYYLDTETTGFNPKEDKIITIQYQKVDNVGKAWGDLIILKEWELGEEEMVRKFFKVFFKENNPFNFIPIQQNSLFDFQFLLERFKRYNLITNDKIDFLFKIPIVDIHSTLIIANNMYFKNSGLNYFTAKKDSGIIIPDLYAKKEYAKIEEYIKQETKSFIDAFEILCRELPKLKSLLKKEEIK